MLGKTFNFLASDYSWATNIWHEEHFDGTFGALNIGCFLIVCKPLENQSHGACIHNSKFNCCNCSAIVALKALVWPMLRAPQGELIQLKYKKIWWWRMGDKSSLHPFSWQISPVEVQGSQAPGLAQEIPSRSSKDRLTSPAVHSLHFALPLFPTWEHLLLRQGRHQLICPSALGAALSHGWDSRSFSA